MLRGGKTVCIFEVEKQTSLIIQCGSLTASRSFHFKIEETAEEPSREFMHALFL